MYGLAGERSVTVGASSLQTFLAKSANSVAHAWQVCASLEASRMSR